MDLEQRVVVQVKCSLAALAPALPSPWPRASFAGRARWSWAPTSCWARARATRSGPDTAALRRVRSPGFL